MKCVNIDLDVVYMVFYGLLWFLVRNFCSCFRSILWLVKIMFFLLLNCWKKVDWEMLVVFVICFIEVWLNF